MKCGCTCRSYESIWYIYENGDMIRINDEKSKLSREYDIEEIINFAEKYHTETVYHDIFYCDIYVNANGEKKQYHIRQSDVNEFGSQHIKDFFNEINNEK